MNVERGILDEALLTGATACSPAVEHGYIYIVTSEWPEIPRDASSRYFLSHMAQERWKEKCTVLNPHVCSSPFATSSLNIRYGLIIGNVNGHILVIELVVHP
jgi:hypothetical protein